MLIKQFLKSRLPLFHPHRWPYTAFHWPAFTFHLFAFLFYRSPINAALVPLAMLFDACIFAIIDAMVSSWQNSALIRLVWRSRKCRIAKFPLDDLLEKHANELFRFVFHPENFPALESKLPSLEKQIRAYVVSPPVSAHLTAFQDLNGSCVMFFNDPREKLRPPQRFNLMHELGHATNANAVSLTRMTFLPRFVASAVWILVFCTGPWFYAVAGLLLQFVIRFVWRLSPANTSNVALHEEMAADRFAAQNADLESVQSTLRKCSVYPPTDSQLGKLNGKRSEFLVSALKARLAGDPVPELPDALSLDWKVSLANISVLAALGFLGVSGSWMGVLGAALLVVGSYAVFLRHIQPVSFYERDLVVSMLERWIEGTDPSCAEDSLRQFIIRMHNQ